MQQADILEDDNLTHQLMRNLERDQDVDALLHLLQDAHITARSVLHHPNDHHKSKQTVLYWACQFNWEEGIALLMLYGGDPFLSYPQGYMTPYEWVVRHYCLNNNNNDFSCGYSLALVNTSDDPPTSQPVGLRRIGRNPDAPLKHNFQPNETHMTALMYAFKNRLKWGICWLLQGRKASIKVQDTKSWTAWDHFFNIIDEECQQVGEQTRDDWDEEHEVMPTLKEAEKEVRLFWFLQGRYPDKIPPLESWAHRFALAYNLIARNQHISHPAGQFNQFDNLRALNSGVWRAHRLLQETGVHHVRSWKGPS
jgi:hypothetical protein